MGEEYRALPRPEFDDRCSVDRILARRGVVRMFESPPVARADALLAVGPVVAVVLGTYVRIVAATVQSQRVWTLSAGCDRPITACMDGRSQLPPSARALYGWALPAATVRTGFVWTALPVEASNHGVSERGLLFAGPVGLPAYLTILTFLRAQACGVRRAFAPVSDGRADELAGTDAGSTAGGDGHPCCVDEVTGAEAPKLSSARGSSSVRPAITASSSGVRAERVSGAERGFGDELHASLTRLAIASAKASCT